MAKILVVYHSETGHTQALAELIASGAEEAGAAVDVRRVEDVTADQLVGYDGIIAGSPTYYGLMSAKLKQLFDDSVRHHRKLDGKVGAAFTSSANIGGGNETTILSILQAMLIHGMIVQGNPMGDHYGPVAIGRPDDRSSKQARDWGRRTALLTKRIAGED